MAYAKTTFIGAINYFENRQEKLFDLFQLPTGLNKEILIDDIVNRAGDFELLYINPIYMRYSLGAFSLKWADTWQHWYDVLAEEYDPLENYNRNEEYTDKHTGTQNNALTGTDTTANTGTQTTTNTGTQTTANTGTQTTANTGTQRTDNTGTQTNNETINERGSKTTTTEGTKETTPSGHDTTVTHHDVYAYNENTEGTVYPKSEDGTITTPGTKITEETGGETTERPLLDTTDNTTRTDNLSETRTDNLSALRTDALNEQRTDNLTAQRTDALSETKTLNETNLRTDNLKVEHTAHLWGNIGTTTSQQMLREELEVRKFNLYDQIADMVIKEYCIMVY